MSSNGKTTDAVEILRRMLIKDDPQRLAALEVERVNAEVAAMIYNLRASAGLNQKQLAALVGTTQSVISRLEDADYEGHSLSMLSRIAGALNRRVKISLTAGPRVRKIKRRSGRTRRRAPAHAGAARVRKAAAAKRS